MEVQPIALLPCRIWLLLAGCLIPSAHRDEWRREWVSELWYRWRALSSQGEWHARSAMQLYLSCLGCFPDAWCQISLDEDRWIGVRTRMRSPSFCAALLGAGLICFAIGSGYFPATRTILSNLPYKNGPQLALVSRTGRLEGVRRGIPKDLAGFWLHDSNLLEAMAACSFVRPTSTSIGGRVFTASSLEATPNLFDVIGEPVSPRIRRSIEGGAPVALLSFSFWQRELHGDPKVIGRQLLRNHRNYFIGGVLPQHFWFLSPSVQIYELDSPAIGDQGVLVVRSKPNVSSNQLEAELSQTADRNDIPFLQTAPHVLFLTDALHTPVWLFASALFIAAVLAGIAHGFRIGRGDHADTRLPKGNWRWWFFLFVKTAMALLLVFIIGVETFGLSRQMATEPLGGPALLWFYITGCSAVLFVVIVDQRARCRVCLQCLAFPIRIGCPGCLFLDWSGTELLCPDGHGMLYVPHHLACWDKAERWVALESF